METVYMDESGYTGYDLLNVNQPFQAASSLIIDEKTAQSLIDDTFPRRRAKELKHKKLSKYKSYWEPLLKIQKIILNDFSGITYVCNKKYFLILQFLDDCVEPFFYQNGINFFKDGHNYALASLLYYTAGTLWEKKQFEDLLFYYQRASKSKTTLNINLLADHAKSLIGKELSEFLLPLSQKVESCIKDILKPDNDTDIVLPVILSLINRLEEIVDNEYIIIHDTSNKLKIYKKIIERFIGISENISFKSTKISSFNFPLKLSAVEQKDSKSSFAIQLADLLVGAVVEHCMSMIGIVKKNDYNQKIMEHYSDLNLLHMLPSTDFEHNKKFRQNNQNYEFVDFIAKKFS
jgi:hypothetical protein